ncbi:MAG: response regulator, partial [Cyanobacteria bacterium]|nr:response regulator [Cyanobacteriota bacterium]
MGIDSSSFDHSQPSAEFLDAVRRHICQILGFDYGFIDLASGHEISNLVKFSAEDNEDTSEFVDSLVDANKQPVTVSNTLVAQKVKQTQRPWVGKAYAPEDIDKLSLDESELDSETDGFPYAIVPVFDSPIGASGAVKGLIRVISFDAAREITLQDLTTLKLMGEHLASPTTGGLFGNFASRTSIDSEEEEIEVGDADGVLLLQASRASRRRFKRVLARRYRVSEAETTEGALKVLDSERVDVIVLESDIQGSSGLAFCKVLKESTKWKYIPVIVIIPEDRSSSVRVEALNVGADDCIIDSCFDAELTARVQSSLRHRKVEREQAVQLQLLEDYAQRLEKAHEQLSMDRQAQIQKNSLLEQLKRESDVLRHQDNLLHRISNIIRRSFDIHDNLKEMLEALSGWFSLDCAFIVMPADDDPQDTLRVEYVSDREYKV